MMKKLIISAIIITLAFNVGMAQTPKKAAKNASRSIASYYLDQKTNKDKLKKATDLIEIAITGEEQAKVFKTWETRGKIYAEIANQINITKQFETDGSFIPKVDNPAVIALASYLKANEFAEKKAAKRKVFTGITNVQDILYAMGYHAYNKDKNYESAYLNFKGMLDAHDFLSAAGKPSSLDADSVYVDQIFFTAVVAEKAEKLDIAKIYYEQLYTKKAAKAGVYSSLYSMNSEADLEGAYKYLEEGRKLFPDDVALLFAEINHFLKQNKMDELIEKLKLAIDKEPDNVSLYTTLGNVYDNLYQTASGEGKVEEATSNFNNALQYYNSALEKDVNSFDAIYSIGALYYNKAAGLTVLENKTLEEGMSSTLLAKADAYKAEATKNFELALPFFKQAENINPNDVNTLIALKEIAVRMDDLEASTAIKERLNNVREGGTNADAYYKN